jgi:general secretion pathway protein D
MKYSAAVLVVLGIFLCGPLRETAWSQAGVQAPAGEAAQKQNPGSAVTAAPDPRVKDPAKLAEALQEVQNGAQPPQQSAKPEAAGSAAAPAAAPAGKNQAEIEELKARFRKLVDSEMKKFGALEEQLPAEAEKPAGQAQSGVNGAAPQSAGRASAPGDLKSGEKEGAPAAKAVSPADAQEAPAPAAEEAVPEEKIKGDKPIAPVAIEKAPAPAGENEGAAEEAGEEEEEPLEGLEEEKPPERVEVLPPQPQKPAEGKQKVALDFQDAELQEVITALAEIVGINYIVDPKVKGKVNIHTSGEIPVEDVLPILETIFEVNNVAAVKMGDIYKVIPIKDAQKQFLIPKVGSTVTDESSPDRIMLQIVPLRYISSTEMDKIIKRFVGKGGDSIDYAERNTLIIVDTADNVRKLLGLIDSVDVSIFDSMHVQFYELKEAEAVDLAKELEELFAAIGIDPKKKKGGEIVSFIPIERMNIILAVSTSPDAFDVISEWVRKLDGTRQDIDEQIFIYFVENAKAVDIADIVKELYGEERSAREKKTTSRKTTSRDKDQKTKTPTASKTAAAKSSSLTGTKGEVTIVVDETNNAIVIRALPQDYAKILKTIKMLDIIPRQVLIEVLIAEVGLDENNEFGVEWTVFDDYASLGGYKGVDRLGQNFNLGGLGQDLTQPIAQTGFTYAFASNALEAFLRAYSRENKVNILSTPHILAADNTEASIDVGQEVPIVTSEYTPTTLESGETYSRSIEYRDTGILLTVTPRINDKGLVAMEVNQEVSDISEQRIEGINSPIILKRQAETSLVVQDGRTIVIGGLIREKTDETQEGLPILSKIPYLGMLFGYQKDTKNKVELLILITPHVIKSFEQAELVTREFTEKVKSLQKLLEQ